MAEPFAALSVSDILPSGILADRISFLKGIRSECPSFSRVCVRNDSFDPGMFLAAAEAVSATGLGLVLESADPMCLAAASGIDRDAILCPTDASSLSGASQISRCSGNPLAVPGEDVRSLMANAESAEGVGSIILNPSVRNMKSALETCTCIGRLHSEHGIELAGNPVMVRAWSGEYALSVASVAVLRGAEMAVLDDLDADGCRVLDALMDSFVHIGRANTR